MYSSLFSNMILNTVCNTGLNMVLNTVLITVLNTNSSWNSNVIPNQFISFSFYIASFSRHILDFSPRSSFIRVNVSNFNKISEYSSSEMESSDNAFAMRLLIVLSGKTANIVIFSCFLVSNTAF